ncbi:uncharacterized protein LOC132929571 [Rhopalosiphum padi]|uniref:uncharacterized protein LOC132929571 n=1 Tax=Rhopalosiphum padi TaxID=40932 RepID=UPI00298D8F77|nr:uncharacterized protein LOC132929571 [Rhopalosiphum padi]XP_060850998.1 uncharacterized protein LOC132929571 [Rhopalosiphum padi]
MSSNGSDAKKRKLLNNEEAILESSTKKIKVQAQRKFAQNAVIPTSTAQKPIQTPVVPNNVTKPPIKRPNTEDFLTFLCFRGTSLLPPRLDFFNKPQRSLSAQEIAAGKKRRKSTPILPVTNANNPYNVNSVNNESIERKNISQLSQTKFPLSKLGQKVMGRKLVRSSSRYTVRQEALTLRQLALRHVPKLKKSTSKVIKPLVKENNKKKTEKNGKQVSLDGKQIQKLKGRITRSNSLPSIFCPAVNQLRDDKGKWCKGSSSKPSSKASDDSKDVEEERPSRKKTASNNLDHRSNSLGNMKRKTSIVKCKVANKNNRKTRSLASKSKSSDRDNYVVPDKKVDKTLKTVSKSNKANSLIETKPTVDVKRRTSSVDNMKTTRESKDIINSTRSRPPRRTKEAATLFMEMLRKDMRCPDEQEEDDTSSVESFPDLPNTRINEQRERELKVFSKQNKMEKHQEEHKLSEKRDDKPLSDSKKTKLIDKKKVEKLKKKFEENNTLEKKKTKEVIESINFTENSGAVSFKRNLRPRRSSTMLDDYIMTDSDEDDIKCESLVEVTKCEAPKSSNKVTIVAGNSKSQKCKLSTDESVKKNLKINKTDLKPKKDLNKDSEVKKSLSETKSKSILLKRDKELEIKNNKNGTVDKKNEKSSKNKTEILVITKEPKTTGSGSKNAGKKVPLPKQQSTKNENALSKKKSNLDLYNNNDKKKRSTSSSSSSSMFSGITSQTKEELLERMAENFDAISTACEGADKAMLSNIADSINSATMKKNVQSNAKEKRVDSGMVEKNMQSGSIVAEKKIANEVNSVKNKQELEKVSKTENLVAVPKEENVLVTTDKVENVIMVVDKVEKTESVVVPLNKVEKVENMVFQTIAKDLFLGQQKEIKITIPEYFTGKNFQLDNRFKQDDGLSVLSEICSALPRFNEPFVSSSQLLNKMPTASDSSFVKYVPPTISEDEKPPVPTLTPPSFESRTVKIVNLARGSSSSGTNDKNDLAASWKQAFKNVKLPKNGIASAAVSVGNNLIAWTKKKQNDNQTPPSKTYGDGIDDGTKEIVSNSNLMKNTLQSSSLINGTTEKKSEPSYKCQKTCCGETKTMEILDSKKTMSTTATNNASYLAKTTILNSTKYDLKFEKRSSSATIATTAAPISVEKQQQIRKDIVGDVSSSDDQSPEKKIFHQRRLSTTQSCSGNSSDAFSPDNETSVYAFQPDLPVASTPFRRNKPQSPAKSRTVSPNTSIAVSIENDSMEEKSHQSTVSSTTTDVDSEEGRLFYIPLPAGVRAQPMIQGVTVKLGTEGPQKKLVMSAKLVTKPPASTIPVSSISPKPERKIKPLCTTKITNSTTPVGTVQPTTRTVQPPKCTPSTSKQALPLLPQPQIPETKDDKKRLQQITTTTNSTTTAITSAKESKKSSSVSATNNKKQKKTEKQVNNKRKSSEKVALKKKSSKEYSDMLDAPTFYPSEEDFKDPLEYFEIIKPVAQKYGICRVVPPPSFKPECKVSDDMRFTAYNQYVHKMMNRWGPNVREMIAMKKYLETQSIVLSNPPLIGGMELDLPKLYHTVQELGGLKEVIELDKWCRVADLMKIPKSAQDRVTKLDDIYCKYLLPYDTLSHDERQKLIAEVDKEWKQICKKGDTDDELYEDVNDCIAKGRSIALSAYYRVARNTVAMWFKEQQQQQPSGSHSSSTSAATAAVVRAEDVESLYWKNVQDRKNHICVLSGSIDSGAEGYGFPTTKTATFTKHPWNLKVLTNNPVSVLKSLGPVMGMTVPTIHMGMVFSACCWYKDPHGLPWIEYLHTGADKVWYGVPSDQSDRFRAAMKRLLPRAVAEGQNHHSWLAADSGMVPPSRLLEHGVTLTRTVQNPGQFLIVMPRAYTCNVSTGYVISESVYFTQPGWLDGAEKIFQDLQKNCEPAAFSFEKLLINMSTDSRTPQNILKQLLNMLSNMRDCEVALRSQLVEDLGLKASERIRPTTSKSNENNDDYECDVCHSILYISMVNNSHEDCDYCLRHGIEILSKKHNQLKYCKFLYTFDETDLDMILVKLRERIDSKKKKTSTKS